MLLDLLISFSDNIGLPLGISKIQVDVTGSFCACSNYKGNLVESIANKERDQ